MPQSLFKKAHILLFEDGGKMYSFDSSSSSFQTASDCGGADDHSRRRGVPSAFKHRPLGLASMFLCLMPPFNEQFARQIA